jgi:hypothetical protein
MAQMFCTLKQAADRLETTEAEIETMLNDGVLREFRDGSSRLLKVADLAAVTLATTSATTRGRPAQVRGKTKSPRPTHDDDAIVLPDLEIKLPAAAAVTTRMSPHVVAPKHPRPTQRSTGRKQVPRAIAPRRIPAQCPQSPPRAVVISPDSTPQRPRPQTHELSLRQWLWTGLLDDDPLAIFIVFGTALLGISAVAGAIYLLARAL